MRKILLSCLCLFSLVAALVDGMPGASPKVPSGKKLRTILNTDRNIIRRTSGSTLTPEEFRRGVGYLLDAKPGVLALDVGNPDPVIYRSEVATNDIKYRDEWTAAKYGKDDRYTTITKGLTAGMRNLLAAGTDPLQLSIEECRKRGVLIVASYRMNSEDFYEMQRVASDFDRANQDKVIPGAHCLDPAHPEVFKHRMAIFREVVEKYDIDGIEFNFRRWHHMISDPLKNYPILTKMVAETRQMLDEVAKKKGRNKLLLGVYVAGSLDTPEAVAKYAGSSTPGADPSCKELGLDVKTWIEKGYVDYVCPTLFWPRLPGLPWTKEFVALAKGTNVGIYPTLFPLAPWMEKGPDSGPIEVTDTEKLRRYRDDLCQAALQCYADGADGINTFNWVHFVQPGMMHDPSYRAKWGVGAKKAQMVIHPKLGSPSTLRKFMKQADVLGAEK